MTTRFSDVAGPAAAAAPRPPTAWWRLRWTIRTLLIVVTVLALFLAWIGRTIREVQHHADVAKALDERFSDPQPNWSAIAFGDWSSVDITDIDISYRQYVSDDVLEQFGCFPKLEEVSVCGQTVTDRSFKGLNGMKELKSVTIEACDITDETMTQIATLQNLGTLVLRGVAVTDKGLAQIQALPNLHSLTLEFTLISPEAIKNFQDARPECVVGFVPAANKQEVEAAKGIMRRDANILLDSDTRLITVMIFSMNEKPWRSQDWKLLPAIPGIQAVAIDGLPTTTEAIREVKKLPNLERLTLESMPVTASEILQLGQFSKLVDLEFQPEKLNDQQLIALGKLQNLRTLKIEPDGGTITRRGITALAQLKGLKHLQLSNVPIVDEDLEPLTGLSSLTTLDLSSTPITDQALDFVLKMPQVNDLILNETQITGVGAQRIIKSPQIQSASWSDTGIKPEMFVRPANDRLNGS
jgi:Leucine-rich repeat (LRR) protein